MTKRTPQGLIDKRARERRRHAALTLEQRSIKRRKQRDAKLKRVYGITQRDYEAILTAQGGTCAICYESLTERRAHIDHNHDTGAVRGVLCGSCNRGIGWLRDDAELTRRASLYLLGIRDYD